MKTASFLSNIISNNKVRLTTMEALISSLYSSCQSSQPSQPLSKLNKSLSLGNKIYLLI